MKTEDNILILETVGRANEINDSPALRRIVDEIRDGKRSPLVDLTEHLKSKKGGGGGRSNSRNKE
jgi:hypothetical protein